MKFKHKKQFGKHTHIMNNQSAFAAIIKTSKDIDKKSRVIPTQFGRIKTPESSYKLKMNSNNPYEIFIQISHLKWFQRLKIECSTRILASKLHHRLVSVLSEEFDNKN